ncbi:MAG TPA: DUF5803 family protein [Methanospirillum sp.]|nr:DUF5803 family protein [Methanospirillum sp.]
MRRNTRITAGCLTALILVLLGVPVSALNVTYLVSENGTSYGATASVNSTDKYEFFQSGMLGERVPLEIHNISLWREGVNTSYTEERGVIRFESGNYTIRYDGKISGNTIQAQFTEPGEISVVLPEKLKVDNPLLTSIQPGGSVISHDANASIVRWEKARYLEIRFYDAGQENLLSIFAQFWLIIAVMLLLPFVLSRNREN